MFIQESDQPVEDGRVDARKPYHKPELEILGDLRSLTLGGSPGTGDSGGSTVYKFPGGMPQPGGWPLLEDF